MVAACTGCDALEPWACSIVGIGAGFSYFFIAMLVEKLRIDDPVDTVGSKLDNSNKLIVMMSILLHFTETKGF